MALDRRATKVWKRLTQIYGARFVDAYGKDVSEPWSDAIDDLTDEQIAYGLRAVQRETPIHPPTLGQFVKSCSDMPIAQAAQRGPTVAEQLCAYVMLTRFPVQRDSKFTPDQMRQSSLSWTYLYREWTDASRPKGMERCAECTGVLVPACGSLEGFRVNAIDMLGDLEGHAKAMRSFKPGESRRTAAR